MMVALSSADAVGRLSAHFAARPSRAALLVRAALHVPSPDDAGHRDRLVIQLRADSRPDGSVGGSLLATAWRAIELLELGHGPGEPGTARAIDWVLTLQGRPGAFGDDCPGPRNARHLHRACSHYMCGFFAPAPPTQRLAPITLPNGKVFRAEAAARFAVSCVALRAVLQAGHAGRPLVEQHVASLLRLEEAWEDWGGYYAPDLVASALSALARAPSAPTAAVARIARAIAHRQRPDGTWPDADLFHTLDALLAARDAVRAADDSDAGAELDTALRRATPALLACQRPDGSFGPTAREERGLIGLQVLLVSGR